MRAAPPPQILSRRLWAFALALLAFFVVSPLMAQGAKKTAKRATFTNSVGMTFVNIPAGSFMMGTQGGQKMGECPDCKGAGKVERARTRTESGEKRCMECGGRGKVECMSAKGEPHYPSGYTCYRCNGTRQEKCGECNGVGFKQSTRTVTDGYDIRLCSSCKGKGKRMIETGGGRSDEKPAHKVTISKAFFMSRTEVTQGQWKAVMGTTPWRTDQERNEYTLKEGADYPVIWVSWNDAMEFCRQLSRMDGKKYGLPSEAEWEYACRAGSDSDYSFGNTAESGVDYAWYDKTSESIGEPFAHAVGTKTPNPWGLHDMHGNVQEWCEDVWYNSYLGAPNNGNARLGNRSKSGLVTRGGCWRYGIENMRSTARSHVNDEGGYSHYTIGFRVVCR